MDPGAFEIRPAVAADAAALSELAFRSKAYWGYSPRFMEACRDELTVTVDDLTSGRCYNLIEAEQAIAGYYALERVATQTWELEALFVAPQYIGQGLGRRLMDHAKALLREQHAQTLVIQGDPNAEAFYRAAGAKRIGERESESIPGRYLPVFHILL